MPKLFKTGLTGFIIVVAISFCVAVSGGEAIYTAPLAMPFAVIMLIGWSMRERKKD